MAENYPIWINTFYRSMKVNETQAGYMQRNPQLNILESNC